MLVCKFNFNEEMNSFYQKVMCSQLSDYEKSSLVLMVNAVDKELEKKYTLGIKKVCGEEIGCDFSFDKMVSLCGFSVLDDYYDMLLNRKINFEENLNLDIDRLNCINKYSHIPESEILSDIKYGEKQIFNVDILITLIKPYVKDICNERVN